MGVDITPVAPVADASAAPGELPRSRRLDPGMVLSVASVAPALAVAAWLLATYPLAYAGHATPLLALPAFAVVAALVWLAARRLPAVPDTPWWSVLGTGAIAVGFAVFTGVFASGHVVLRRDSAVYALFGRWIADSGGLRIPAQLHWIGGSGDKLVTATAQALYPTGDRLAAQFMSGTGLTLAPFGWVGGWTGMLLAPALIGGCALLAFGGLAARLVGPRWAPVAALALALVLPMILTFRSTYSEPLAQLLMLAALCLLLDAVAGTHRWLAGLAGLLMGLGLLVRIDAVRDLALLVPVVAWLALRRSPCWWPLALGAVVGAVYGVVDALGPTYPYVHDLRSLVKMAVYLGVLLIVVCTVGVLVGRRWLPATPPPPLVGTAAAGVVVVGLVALVTRPLWYVGLGTGGSVRFIEGLQRAQGVVPVDGNRNYAEDSLTWVSWYTGWPTLVLAGAALALLTRYAVLGRRDPVSGHPATRWILGLALPVVSALSVLWSPGITPDHPWADRRLVPTVLPVVALLAVWSVAAATRRWGRPALVLGLVVVLVPAALGSRHLALSRTEAGEPQAVDTACAAFEPGEVALLVDARSRQEWTAVLREVCGVPAFGVPGDSSDDVATRAQVAEVTARVRAAGGTPVLVAESGDPLPTLTDQPRRQIVDLHTQEQRRELRHPATGLTDLTVQLWRADPD
ncbi:MAG TPA: hypothetical protein VH573_02335 [Mycobacteriales bacterium]